MSTAFETIIYSVEDAIAEIRLNRPHRLNAVTQQLYDELNKALDQAQADRQVRVVIITGEGRAFCVGADLKEHKQGRTAFDRRQYLRGEQEVCKKIHTLKKPVISAVNGFALGAGAEIAIASDFLVMAASAKIGLPEISIGNFLGGGVTTLGMPLGVAVIVFTIIITWIYIRRANSEFDSLTEQIVKGVVK